MYNEFVYTIISLLLPLSCGRTEKRSNSPTNFLSDSYNGEQQEDPLKSNLHSVSVLVFYIFCGHVDPDGSEKILKRQSSNLDP